MLVGVAVVKLVVDISVVAVEASEVDVCVFVVLYVYIESPSEDDSVRLWGKNSCASSL
jgi:hypothetical protein